MSNLEKKPDWKTSKWWLETFGLYRDERIDASTHAGTVTLFWIYSAMLALAAGYMIFQRHWAGWAVAAAVAACVAFAQYHYWPLRETPHDEFLQKRYAKRLQWPGTFVILLPIVLWLAPINTPVDSGIWALLFSIPVLLYYFYTMAIKRLVPLRTALLTLILTIGGFLFGFYYAVGSIPRETVIIGSVIYAIVLVISLYIWWRQGQR